MPRPFALQTVLELMQNRTDNATQRLARLLAAERDAKKKLEMLQHYRDEYGVRFRQAARDGLGQPEWRNFQQFIDRLDEAITQQHEAVRAQEQHTAAGQEDWQKQRARMKAFDALAERHRSSEERLEQKQEQKTQDEFAARGKSNQ